MPGIGNKQIQFPLVTDALKKKKKSVSYHAAKAIPAGYNINSGGEERRKLSSVWE